MLQLRRDGLPASIRRPSTARYEMLVQQLVGCEQLLESQQGDPLGVAGFALASVIEFLVADEAVMDAGITNPLSIILNALHDLRHGGKPPLLFERSGCRGRPTDQTFDAVKAAAAMGIEVLLPFKVSRSRAGQYVASVACNLKLKQPNGKAITSRTVLGWRDEIETAKSEIGAKVFRGLKERRISEPPLVDEKQARALAREYLVQARFAGFWVRDADCAD